MSEVLQPGHPDADELNAFMENALPAGERERTLAHLATCGACRMVVALASGAEEEPVRVVVEEPRRWRLPVWVWGLPVAAVFGLAFVTVRRETPRVVENAPVEQATMKAPEFRPPPPEKAKGEKRIALGNDNKTTAPAMAATPALQRSEIVNGLAAAAPMPVPPPPPVPAAVTAPQPMIAAQSAVATAASASATVASVDALSDESATVAVARPGAMAPMRRAGILTARPLPSGLAVVSVTTAEGATLALDSGSHLFVTRDGGAHWEAVEAKWTGKAVRLGLVEANPDLTTSNASPMAKRKGSVEAATAVFELVMETGDRWVSGDGVNWVKK
jgi:hypothetical protein